MKNRDKYIGKINEYDMLDSMNKRLMEETEGEYCIMSALPHKEEYCSQYKGNCDACLREWLNEEA